MKKRILSLLLAICMIASLLPLATLAADSCDPATILIAGNEVAPNEGEDAVYFKTDATLGTVSAGTESDHQVKVYFPAGGVPTIELDGAYIQGGNGHAIQITQGESVNIIVKNDSQVGVTGGSYAPILSDATGDLTIRSENGARLYTTSWLWHGGGEIAAIRSVGNIKLENAVVAMQGEHGSKETDRYIWSQNGSITISGGSLNIATSPDAYPDDDNAFPLIDAPSGTVTINNGADVAVINNRNTFVFGNNVTISDSSVKVAAINENSTVFAGAPTLNYAKGYDSAATATAPSAVGTAAGGITIVSTDAGEYNAADAASYKYFSVAKKAPASVSLVIGTQEVTVSEGGTASYLKADATTGAVSTGTEADSNIVVSFPEDGKATITLDGAYICGDTYAIQIKASTEDVVINVVADCTLENRSGGGVGIDSNTTGNLIIKGEGRLLLWAYKWHGGTTTNATIRSYGNIKLENANVAIYGSRPGGETDMHMLSHNGDIIVDGGALQIETAPYWDGDHGQYPIVHAPEGKIIVQNGANVIVVNKRSTPAFKAAEGITVDESSVTVAATHENGTLFETAPTLNFQLTDGIASATVPAVSGSAATGLAVAQPEDAVAYNAADYATYKYYTVTHHVHTPLEDDGDCTTPVGCATCTGAAIPAKTHTPATADDGDCTTAIACGNDGCTKNAVEAKSHTGGTATCTAQAVCTNDGCGKAYGSFAPHQAEAGSCDTDRNCSVCGGLALRAGQHVPGADDGDCTTPVACIAEGCGGIAVAAKTHTGGKATCVALAVCANPGCTQAYGDLAECVPGADDGDCTTAILCTVCGAETTPAKSHTGGEATCRELAKCDDCGKAYGDYADHISNIDDGDCTTAVKCFVCGAETVPAGTHTGGKATCKKLAKCENCGQEYGELAAHTPGVDDGDCTTAVNCTYCGEVAIAAKEAHTPAADDGDCTTAVMCAECGKEAIAAKEHTPGDAATCTTAQTCTACGTELAAALGHNYEAVVTEPDCVNGGYTTYTCSVCGDTYTDDEVDALGHTAGDAATCTTAQTCTVCGAELAAALGHTPGDAATCTTAQKCTVCEAELEAAKGHTPGEAATCTTAQKCTVCEAELEAAKGHTPGEAATCTTAQKCTVCEAELVAAKGHTPAADDGDCTTAIACSVCGAETTAAKEAHTYTDNADTTCDNEGCTNTRKVEDTSKPGTNGSPQTGDANEIVLFVAVLCLLAAGFVSVVVFNKKRNAAN